VTVDNFPLTQATTDYLSSETESFFLPFLRRAAKTLRPLAVDILWRNPCLLALFLRDGWNVLFIFSSILELQKYKKIIYQQEKFENSTFSCVAQE
jgi:hypothetical protein